MQEVSLSEYMRRDRGMNVRGKKQKFQKKIRIALLGSSTLNGFKEVLNVKCRDANINASFYINDYNQYVNELLDEKSRFYSFRPDITFLIVDIRALLGDLYHDPYAFSEKRRKAIATGNYKKLSALVRRFTRHGSGIIVMNNFEIPTYSPMGILEPKQKYGFHDMIKDLNSFIGRFNEYNSVFVFDYDSFASDIGKSRITDDKLFYLADMKISPNVIPFLCENYMRYIRALLGLARKCIVLDMDNTLWGGIVGEDGLEGIKLGPTPPGNAYMEFQRYIVSLFHRGIILAVNSNNNREDVIEVMKKHPHMILKERHFASIKANWENKVKNLADISKDVNIGLNSIIYLDDDKRNRQLVREALPEVYCPDLPEDASQYVQFIKGMKDIDALQITHEDLKRGKLYAAERKRAESMDTFSDLTKYLIHLNVSVEVRSADKFSIPRISQLTLRTNQFNFSTKRYNEKEIEKFASDKRYAVYYIKVKDKYGDYGITGALIIEKDKKYWFVDTFLLSCRILGRNIEDSILNDLIRRAIKAGVDKVDIGYKKTEKNHPVEIFLKKYGISLSKYKRTKEASVMLYKKGQKQRYGANIGHIKVVSR